MQKDAPTLFFLYQQNTQQLCKMKQMIYCNLKEQKTDSAVYAIGATTNDMTGEITFYKDPCKPPKLEKQPERYPLREKYILRLYVKYASDFAEGSFPNRIAYEIG